MTEHSWSDARVVGFEEAMRAEGRAEHTSLARAIRIWDGLGRSVGGYAMTVDDYTNDLCSRDYLEQGLIRLPPDLVDALSRAVEPLDRVFRAGTAADEQELLRDFFRIEDSWGWWWHRIPSAGPLADYLAASRHR